MNNREIFAIKLLLSEGPISSHGCKYVGGAAQVCNSLCPTH